MQILLWRHADALPGNPDRERQLSDKGHEQARKTARWLNRHLPDETVILVSPARRTRQTADALERDYTLMEALGIGVAAETVLNAVKKAQAGQTILLVGHQPQLGEIASILLNGKKQDIEVHRSAVWWFELESDETAVLDAVMHPGLISE